MSDISGVISGAGLALEQEAFKQFGAAVQGATRGALGSIFGQSKKPALTPTDAQSVTARSSESGIWSPTPYASAIASGAGNYDPKTKFLFKVKFSFHDESITAARAMNIDLGAVSQNMTFIVKQIDLPKLEFNYEEVNMYNFRTKILTSIKHREINMSFYDDSGNAALDFVNAYLQMLQPISRKVQMPEHLEDHGFAFSDNYTQLDTAHRSAILQSTRTGIMSEMVIEQFYLDRTASDVSQAVKMNSFTFTNPRLTNVDISDQDHEQGGAVNTIAAIFDFDSLHIDTGANGLTSAAPSLPGGDLLNAMNEGSASARIGPQSQAGKAMNPFIDILARQGQRAVQVGLGSILHKGMGGVAGGALSGAISDLTGALGFAANRTLTAVGSGISQGLAIPAVPPLKDNSTPLGQVIDLSSQTAPNDLGDFYG